jgi:NarL family two-component system response regulator LiaR
MTTGDSPIRVLIVDDHAVVREGLRTFLELQDGIEVVGEAGDGLQALEQAQALSPDVILMDLVMPRLDGVAAMRLLRERDGDSRVIVLTSFLDDDRLMPALQAGASGYLLKDVEPAELARAVRVVGSDQAMIDPTVAARLLRNLSEPGPQAPVGDPEHTLTRREHQVLELIAVGHLLAKLGVSDRTQAALLAVRRGLVRSGRAPAPPAPPARS